jgi:uncharacterized protein involved in propanediol utilization
MFFLSPLLWLSRKARSKQLGKEAILEAMEQEHKVPSPILNKLLSLVFCAETPLGHIVSFPWGTSILGIFEKK